MIVVTARAHVAPENRERFVEVATEMCSRSREDRGCAGYRVYADLEQPDRYIIVEEWADDEALQEHFAQPHTTKFLGALAGLLAEPADALFHTVASSRRLDPARGLIPLD
jgi:quinol monooxygenase YgiN